MSSQSPRSSQPPAPARYEEGDLVLGRYRLEAPIGFGGMGTVWRAHNESLGSHLALKLIRDTGGDWPASGSQRLLVEAKTTASLRHPSIVRVFDFGQTERGDSFIAMELLAGESLRQRLDTRGPLPAVDAVRTLLPILAGLGCAHARGIIHRDLKPDNIFLARDDAEGVQPKVLDFGIAMSQSSVSRLTTAGILLGSPSYMSPEQALGEEKLDLGVDIWGLAVVLYEAVAGRTPWHARSCPVLLRAIVDDEPPSLIGIGGVDAELWKILMRGLAKRRADRWPSTRAFGAALAQWLVSAGITADVSGASLQSAWLGHQIGDVRPSLRSIPPSCSTPTTDQATWQLSKALRPARGGRRSNWAAAGAAILAGVMLLWSGRVRTTGAAVVASASNGAPALAAGSNEEAARFAWSHAAEPSPAPAAPAVALAPISPAQLPVAVTGLATGASQIDARRPRPARTQRGVRRVTRTAVDVEAQAAVPSPRSMAREMDFGF